MAIDLDELERLAAEATPLPWGHEPDENFLDHDCQIIKGDTAFVCEFVTEANAAYITAACNSLPELIAENRELRERVRELEREREILAHRLADASKIRMKAYSAETWIELAEKAAKEAGK